MNQMMPYLIFPGTCRQALEFYGRCFGGQTTSLQTFAEAPFEVPQEQQEKVFNAAFEADGLHFRASDNLPPNETVNGNAVSLFVHFSDRKAFDQARRELAMGGQVLMETGPQFVMIRDPYQFSWMLVCEAE